MAVFKFRVKGNGSIGGVRYTEGMSVEVAVDRLGLNGAPFNNVIEKLFVSEFADKYKIESKFQSSIKHMFNRDRLDVIEM